MGYASSSFDVQEEYLEVTLSFFVQSVRRRRLSSQEIEQKLSFE